MKDEIFRFKHFDVSHGKSSMKIGVDGVLLGSWAGKDANKILDIGTGCGLIALMLAQRFPNAEILGIDIDEESVKEANGNFYRSPWSSRLKVRQAEFLTFIENTNEKYDLIVSNPPFFQSGISSPETRREKARHQGNLSPFTLVEYGKKILVSDGTLSMIIPVEFREKIITEATTQGFYLHRACFIRNEVTKPEKRVMLEFSAKEVGDKEIETLVLFEDNIPTPRHRELCGDFYLKF